jgi:hypothetical protein
MDYAKLELGHAISIITAIDLSDWGTEVTLSCLYDPRGTSKPYKLIFQRCTEVRFSILDSQASKGSTAELIGFSAGEDAKRRPAIVTTDIFEASITYDALRIVK